MPDRQPSLLEDYDTYPRIEEAFQAALDESLNPRGPELLYEMVASLRLPQGAAVLDLGCGEGKQSIELADRFGFRVLGVDPVRRQVGLADGKLREAWRPNRRLNALVHFQLGAAEALPLTDAAVDLVWCREVLVLIEALDAAFAGCCCVLRTDRRRGTTWQLTSQTFTRTSSRMNMGCLMLPTATSSIGRRSATRAAGRRWSSTVAPVPAAPAGTAGSLIQLPIALFSSTSGTAGAAGRTRASPISICQATPRGICSWT